ncbi:unnamed protein product [Somion occarium]|uniref:Hemerythrin-like domain-containing protein n=1 Tax=Somion occarium TaxID=3059160 RepID=A0ABP1DGD6_9APHY
MNLTPEEEEKYNRLGAGMRRAHNHFKEEFNSLYELADASIGQGVPLGLYLRQVDMLRYQLTAHRPAAERTLFPFLGKRMPSFKEGETHLKAHHVIHEGMLVLHIVGAMIVNMWSFVLGLDQLGTLVQESRGDPSTYSPQEMRKCLDSWRGDLFKHLDQKRLKVSPEKT